MMEDKAAVAAFLVVDDDESVGQFVRIVLKKAGYDIVDYVSSAEEAVSKAASGIYDIVVSDINLPMMDGITLIGRVRAIAPSSDMVIMTGAPTLENAVATIEAGAYDFLVKPFSAERLLVTIRRCCEKRSLSRELQTEKELRAELSSVYYQLKSLDHMKEAFLSTVGHELRTPLTAILGGLDLVADDTEKRIPDKLFPAMKAGALRLKEVIDELLLYAAVRNGAGLFGREQLDLNEAARTIAAESREKIESAGLALDVALFREPAVIEGNRDMILSAIRHLVNNAIAFNKLKGKIKLLVVADKSSVMVRVEDTGSGIPPDQLKSIYDPFYQVADYLTRKTGGLGLGLAIIKQVAEAHNGKVEVDSVPDKGSAFTLILPKKI